jgi:hypothetical protein
MIQRRIARSPILEKEKVMILSPQDRDRVTS